MFRKPKGGKKKPTFRPRESDVEDADGEAGDKSQVLGEANKDAAGEVTASISGRKRALGVTVSVGDDDKEKNVMHQYGESKEPMLTAKDLATREAIYHPEEQKKSKRQKEGTEQDEVKDGLYKGTTQKRNKFLAGPIRAATYVRTTCRFDYQPDICKDYKDTGFCGYGDTCIYLHDRGDSLTGWQLEQQWEEQRQKEQEAKQREMDKFVGDMDPDKSHGEEPVAVAEDGIPFACHLCRSAFTNPVVTTCGHYFCEACIMNKVRGSEAQSVQNASACPVCGKDTHAVFHHPTKLVAKKRRLVGSSGSWEEFANAVASSRQKRPSA